jgi:hypothetical protein
MRGTLAFLALVLSGCSGAPPASVPSFVTEQDLRLMGAARAVGIAHGYRVRDTLFSVRRDGDGWIVQIDHAQGRDQSGQPMVVVGGTWFVRFGPDERALAIVSRRGVIDLTTRPTSGPAIDR